MLAMSDEQPESTKLQNTARALTGFYSTSKGNGDPNPPVIARKKKRLRGSSHVTLELIRNLSTELKTPQQLAAEGDLDSLKSYFEIYGITIKERDESQATLLHHAAAENQVAVMRYLIESGIDLNATDKDGNTALHLAVTHGHTDAVNLLLESRADDTVLNRNKDAPLHIAVRSPDTRILSTFLGHPHVELVVTGYRKRTPLHVVSELDNVEAAEVFHNFVASTGMFKQKSGFRLCAADEDDLTPIHLAARVGSHRVLDLLMSKCMEHGYPPEVVLGFIDEENSTPLHAAIDGGHTKVVEVLLKHGADPLVLKDDQIPPFLLACSQGKLDMVEVMLKCNNSSEAISCCDTYGQSCLHHAAQAINSSRVISFLVEKGASLDTQNNKGQTPLVMAIIAGSTSGAATLLELGADPLIKDGRGCNVLHYAVSRNRRKIAHALLDLPCAASLVVDVDKDGTSPIHRSLKLGLCQFVNPMVHVIQYKLKNIKDCNGNNYLHLAANGGNWRALNILLEIPECLKLLNEVNNYGGTPLHSAAWKGHARSVEVLLSHGAMIHKCHVGMTPFMSACAHGHMEVARLLYTAHPFQLHWTDDRGQTALHHASVSGSPEVLAYLLDIDTPVTHSYAQESFLDVLIERNDARCTAAVIDHERYQECLDLVSPVHPHPMISLIVHMPEMARKVLDRSHTRATVARSNPEYWEKFEFKYLHLNAFPPHGGREGEGEEEGRDGRLSPMSDEKTTMRNHVVRYKGTMKKVESVTTLPKPASKKCPKLAHMEAVQLMVKHDRSQLLTHPVSNQYLKGKWRSYGRWVHLTLTAFIFLQVAFLFLFTVLVPNPSQVQAASANCSTVVTEDGMNDTSSSSSSSLPSCPQFSHGANLCRFIALASASLNTVIWFFVVLQVRLDALNVIKNAYVFIDLMSIVFTAYYLIPTNGLHQAHWEAGAVAVFFAWFSLTLRIQLFDLFGVYISMFLAITRRVFQVLLICFVFVFSFALSFYILAGNLKSYSTLGLSLFVNFGHMLGEIDYEGFVGEDVDGNLQFSWLTYVFVTTLAILMGIVIMNLLIGLAVGDIDEIRSNAIAEKKATEVNFFSKIDVLLPKRLLHHVHRAFVIKYPNHKVSIVRKMWRFFWESLKGVDASLSDDTDSSDDADVDQRSKDVARLREKVEELSMAQERVVAMLNQMKETQEGFVKMMASYMEKESGEDGNE